MRTLLTRAVRALAVIALLGMLTMALPLLLTGDPAVAVLGVEATPEQLAAFTAALNLDASPPERFAHWLGGAVRGDLGTSLVTGAPVTAEIGERLPVTLELLLCGQLLALAITVPVAMRSAWRPGGVVDRISTVLAYLLLSTPAFVLGLALILVLAVGLAVLPATGWAAPDDPVEHLRHLVLPVLTMGLTEAAVLVRVLRADLIATLRTPYILAARSRGLSPWRLLWTRALRPSSFSTVTLVGLGLGLAFGGSVLVETIFAVPGMGRLAASAIEARDFPVIEAVVLLSGVTVVLVGTLVDLVYGVIDPRARHAAAH
ncbi:ABC transporter permease [Allonocardiopsis opalescens]|uniref:Peptide/nickel transport system permease protein n=1 Tax=Allonocardiopsis opalescens TaxID=1144618 RepID=A0A2T0Q9C4_9ACTN|nr:ABC transporter permease [Allonocardiopsis opalescens]PRY00468.1 peptide/nickel transport system permease protein [Allonocardiopsis opalescens]